MTPAFAVVACSACRRPWAVELRHATAKCPHCQEPCTVAGKRRLWEGATAAAAQAAVGEAALRLAGHELREPTPTPRHDTAVDAAAACARGIANKSQRAEMVALALTRAGAAAHGDLVEAMLRSGLDAERAQREVVRMLACDILMEPRAGHYRLIEA